MACQLPIAADATLTYGPATDPDGTALTTGTCTYAIKDAAGTSVGTGTLTHTSGGTYKGAIESTVTAGLTDRQYYWVEITFAQSPYNDFRRIQYSAGYRAEA